MWIVVKSSVERRLGKPLLKAYLFLTLFGVLIVVGGSLVVMRTGR